MTNAFEDERFKQSIMEEVHTARTQNIDFMIIIISLHLDFKH